MRKVLVFRQELGRVSEGFVTDSVSGFRQLDPHFLGLRGMMRDGRFSATSLALGDLRRRLGIVTGRIEDLDRFVARSNAAAVIAHFAVDAALIAETCKRADLPLVTILHGFDVSRSSARMIVSGRPTLATYPFRRRRLIERGALFLAVSDHICRLAVERGFPEDRTRTHYLGIDASGLERMSQGSSDLLHGRSGIVVVVGRLVEKKGVADAIDALALARQMGSQLRLAIIGDGPLRRKLERKVSSLGLTDWVEFLGVRTRAEVLGTMRRASIVCVPSRTASSGETEGLPTVLLEAAALGRPVIATRHAGIPEVIESHRSGILVDESSPSQIALALLELEGDPLLAASIGASGKSRVQREFDLIRRSEELEDELLRIIR